MRVLTGGDDQVHLWRQVLDQEGEGIVDRFGIDNVVVVEDEDEIVRDGGDFVEQGRQDRFGRRGPRGSEDPQHAFSDIRRDRPQSSDEVSQKARGLVVPFVQRQPGGRSPAAGDPFAEERGLAEAGRGGDEDQSVVRTLVQPLDQAGAQDGSRLVRWDIELSGQDRRRHRSILEHTHTPHPQPLLSGSSKSSAETGGRPRTRGSRRRC